MNPALRAMMIGMMVMAGNASAAPICSQVLNPISANLSQHNIDATISSIAQFRMEIDLIKSSQSAPWKSREKIYKKKYVELVELLEGVYSEKEIRTRISAEISKLQLILKEGKAKEAEARAVHTKATDLYKTPFKLTEIIPTERQSLVRAYDHLDAMEYVPKLDALLMATETTRSGYDKSISLFDLKTKKHTVLWETMANDLSKIKFSSNRKYFIALAAGADKKGELYFYDIEYANGHLIKVPENTSYSHGEEIVAFDITPSGLSILLILKRPSDSTKRAFLIDTRTGVAVYQPELSKTAKQNYGEWITEFISETEFVYLADQKLGNYDFKSQTGSNELIYGERFYSMAVSPELNQIFLTSSYAGVTSGPGFKTVSLENVNGDRRLFVEEQKSIQTGVEKMKPLPEGGIFIRQKLPHRANEIMLTQPGMEIQPSINLIDPVEAKPFADIAFDRSGRRVFIYTAPDSNKNTFLQVWEKAE